MNEKTIRERARRFFSFEALAQRLKHVPAHIKTTFAAAMAAGLLTHLYMLTNKLPNHDDIGHLLGCNYGAASGRWLLPAVLKISGNFSTPWLNGLLSVLWLAVACCITVELLRIRRPFFCVLAATLMVSFPTVTSTLTYMFTADGYFLALALACGAVFCAARFRFGPAAAAVLITLSMALYQSYFSVAAALCVGTLILDALDGELPTKRLLVQCLRLFLTLLAGLLLYLLTVKISAPFVPLTDYQGISEICRFSLAVFPKLVADAYRRYGDFFFAASYPLHASFLKYGLAASAVCTIYQLARTAYGRRLPAGKTLLLSALLLVYPLAGNIITVMAPDQKPHLLMLYGLCYALLLPLAVTENAERAEGMRKTPQRACACVIAATLLITSFGYAVAANQAYLKMDVAGKQLASYSTRLLSAIESAPGYIGGMPVALTGYPSSSLPADPSPPLSEFELLGVFSLRDYLDAYTYGDYLRMYHGFIGTVYSAGSDQAAYFKALPEVAAMPAYPSEGSVRVIEGCVVVKLRW